MENLGYKAMDKWGSLYNFKWVGETLHIIDREGCRPVNTESYKIVQVGIITADTPQVTNDDTRDTSIRIINKLMDNEVIERAADDDWNFELQDDIHEVINGTLNVKED